jgi:hypothetical protein
MRLAVPSFDIRPVAYGRLDDRTNELPEHSSFAIRYFLDFNFDNRPPAIFSHTPDLTRQRAEKVITSLSSSDEFLTGSQSR